jgi:glutathione peroxidase
MEVHMRRESVRGFAVALVAALVAGTAPAADSDQSPASAEPAKDAQKDRTEAPTSVLGFTMADIDGKEVKLSRYKGKVLLVVNTASRCGFTPQYEGLEALYRHYKKQGFEVLAFPANEFGQQEPGTNEEIKAFCKTKYDVTFPIFSKIVVKGEGQHALYRFLTDEKAHGKLGGEIRWNFTKFLIGRDGAILARFEPRVDPQDERLTHALRDALAAPAPKEGAPAAP